MTKFLITSFLLSLYALAPFNPNYQNSVFIHYQGVELEVKQITKGQLILYMAKELKTTGPPRALARKKKVKRYYLKVGGNIVKLTPHNYKKLIRQHLPELKELHQSLGRIGFRYQQIPFMVAHYNNEINRLVSKK